LQFKVWLWNTFCQAGHKCLIITISRPAVVATQVSFGVYEPVSQTGKNNKSWEVIPQNERNMKIQEKKSKRNKWILKRIIAT
jgi:hypothetical protein